jgi:nucleoporin POM152
LGYVSRVGWFAALESLTLSQFPWQTWILGFFKVFYDREVAISEHNVKISSIIHNSSLIMGKQIINILPEG